MVDVEQEDQRQFDMHIAVLKPFRLLNDQGCTHSQGDDCRRPGDAKPKAGGHHNKLFPQYGFLRLRLFIGFKNVHKQPRHIEETGEPGDDKDYMDGFQVQERHNANVCREVAASKFFSGRYNRIALMYLARLQGYQVLSEIDVVVNFPVV